MINRHKHSGLTIYRLRLDKKVGLEPTYLGPAGSGPNPENLLLYMWGALRPGVTLLSPPGSPGYNYDALTACHKCSGAVAPWS